METLFYFDSAHAIAVHDWIIVNTGGAHGVKDIALLESPLEMIQHDDYYPNIESKLTFLFYSINKNHAFIDGNKRSSIVLCTYFLQLNGYAHVVKRFVKETENIAVWVAENRINRDLLHKLLCSLIFEEDYSEALKLEMVTALLASEPFDPEEAGE